MTKIGGNNTFSNVFPRWGNSDQDGWQKMILRDADHTPYNKRSGSVRSILNVELTRFMPNEHQPNSGPYIGFNFEEITTTGIHGRNDKPRTAGRNITHEFPMQEALKIAKFILEAATKRGDQDQSTAWEIVNTLHQQFIKDAGR